jgi:outer membrane lipoprotein-sorting protein
MNPYASRTSRRDDRPRPRSGRAVLALFGLVIASSPWSLPTFAGESPQDTSKAQIASAPNDSSKASQRVLDASTARPAVPAPAHVEADPIARAKAAIASCKAKYQTVQDYTCTFFKRERIDGKLYTQHIMSMKARTKPASLYFKFIQPNSGREAIFIHGKNNDKIVAHDVGFGRLVAGTMHLDPKGDMAMEENRHPVTEAGLGSMIDLVKARWDTELHPGESILLFHPKARVGDRACLLVESIHPKKSQEFLFHKVKLYIDRELNLPIRFEAYDWPKQPGAEPELLEEYTYTNLKTNVGLKEHDFDPANAQYSYGRF